MTKSVSLRTTDGTSFLYQKSETFYYTGLGKGDEIADYSINYTWDSSTTKTRSDFKYGAGFAVASLSGLNDAMTKSVSLRTTDAGLTYDKQKSETFYYTGYGKGDEIADYSINYTWDSTAPKTKSSFYYGATEKVASLAALNDAMTKSVSLRTIDGGTTYDKQKSETFYYIGYGKGDEIAEYSINYNWDSTAKKTRSTFKYGASYAAANAAGLNDAMTESVSLRTTDGTNFLYQKSETFYYTGLGKGDEIADYSINYTWDSSTKKTRSDFKYGAGFAVASLSGLNDAMTKSVSLRTTDAGLTYDKQKSETFYYTGYGKGDEIADYSINYTWDSSAPKTKSSFYYGATEKVASLSGLNDAMTKSVSLRTIDGGTTYDKQKSETFYYIGYGKGDEIADYSINYNWDSTAKKTRSTFKYGASYAAANAAGLNDAMTESVSLRTTDGTNFLYQKSETFYYTGLGKGDEIADYSINYTWDSSTKKTRSDFKYGAGFAVASLSGLNDAMTKSVSLRTTDAGLTYDKQKSETFYYTGYGKGDEIADYSINYTWDSSAPKTKSSFYYGATEKVASLSGLNDAMTKSVSLRTIDGGTTYDKQKSETFYYIGYGKGDEIADYSINYNWDSTAKKTRSTFKYGASYAAANAAGLNDAMTESVSLRTTDGTNFLYQKSETFYYTGLGKGDEIADYSINYTWDSSTKKTRSDFKYGAGFAVASLSGLNDAMTKSVSLRTTDAGLTYDKQKSETFYYTGYGKGDEIADYSINYTWDSSAPKTKSSFYYGATEKVASLSGLNDAMTKSVSLRTIDGGTTYDKQKSETFYYTGYGKGDEIADYSINYNWDSTAKKTRSTFKYGASYAAANAAGLNDAMTESVSLRTTDGTNFLYQKSETFYYTGLGKGDEIADYSINYTWDSSTKKTRSDFKYGAGFAVASLSGLNDAMTKSVSLRTTDAGLTYDKQKSETFYYTGHGKGDEIADYSINYTWDSSAPKTKSSFYYGATEKVASLSGLNDAMTKSVSLGPPIAARPTTSRSRRPTTIQATARETRSPTTPSTTTGIRPRKDPVDLQVRRLVRRRQRRRLKRRHDRVGLLTHHRWHKLPLPEVGDLLLYRPWQGRRDRGLFHQLHLGFKHQEDPL